MPKRKRTVEPLKAREKKRAAENPKPKSNFVLPGENPNAPQIFVSKDVVYKKYQEALKNFPWKKLTFTFLLILIGGVGQAAFQARNTNIQTDITRAERELRSYQDYIFATRSQLQEHYSDEEIRRIATERLDMSNPDPSHVIDIEVPRVGGVTLNTVEHVLPQHNYFWHDVSNFFSGLLNQIFGG